jgi:hypothetical protein
MSRSAVERAASRLGCTPGQVWTLSLTLALSGVIGVFGVVPASRGLSITSAGEANQLSPPLVEPLAPQAPPAAPPAEALALTAPPPAGAVDLPAAPEAPAVQPLAPAIDPAPPVPAPEPEPEQATTRPAAPAQPDAAPSVAPLAVTQTAWFTSGSSPMAVPEKTLPVGAFLGSLDKLSLLRLTGQGEVLTLEESPDGQSRPESAAIRLCPVRNGSWRAGGGQPEEQLPDYDCDAGIDGDRSGDGRWTFPLPDTLAPAGYALVPQIEMASTFRVSFAEPA